MRLRFTSLLFLSCALTANSAWAEGEETVSILPTIDYSGDLADRSTLTGDWGGVRNDLSKNGVQFDTSLNHVTAHVAQGGGGGRFASHFLPSSDDTETHMSYDNVLRVDTGKAGLWPGGVLTLRGEGRVGEGVNGRAGTIAPVDGDALFPLDRFGKSIYDLDEATFTQFVSPYAGVMGGIVNTLDADNIAFSDNTRLEGQFFNLAFGVNPVQLAMAPYKSLGAGLILLPTKNPNDMILSAVVMNHEDSSGEDPFEHDQGTSTAVEFANFHHLGSLPGKQVIGYMYTDDDFRSLDDPRIGIAGREIEKRSGSNAAYYSFNQYLIVQKESPQETTGIGLFGRFGLSDGNPNPIRYAVNFGVGGNTPWRELDTFGVGYYFIDASDEAFVERTRIDDEQGIEAWYNVGITPWLHLTPDFQYVNSGLPGSGDVYIFGIRTHVTF
ncbi:MAG: carbohydrate porin [Bdellovibrionota bacterium]